MQVYIDGQYYPKDEAKISVYDHGLLYGDGVFEGIRIYNGSVFKLDEHLQRLYQSAKAIILDVPLELEKMADAVQQTVKLNKKQNGYIRLVVTRGIGNLGLNPYQCPKASVIIIVDDIELYPEEHYQKGIGIVTSSLRRVAVDSIDPRIKSLNYLNNILAKIEAIQGNCLEAVILNQDGFVAECTADNIFIVKNHVLLTPSSTHGALDGITKSTVLTLADKIALPTKQTALAQYDLYNADECFITGTGAEIMPVVNIDGRDIGNGLPGEISKKLTMAFRDQL